MLTDTSFTKKWKVAKLLEDFPSGIEAMALDAEMVPKQKRKKPSLRRSTLNKGLETDNSSSKGDLTMSLRGGHTQLSKPVSLTKA